MQLNDCDPKVILMLKPKHIIRLKSQNNYGFLLSKMVALSYHLIWRKLISHRWHLNLAVHPRNEGHASNRCTISISVECDL